MPTLALVLACRLPIVLDSELRENKPQPQPQLRRVSGKIYHNSKSATKGLSMGRLPIPANDTWPMTRAVRKIKCSYLKED